MTESMSNLEAYLRSTNGINIMLRKRMVKAYDADNGQTLMKDMLTEGHAHGLVTDQAYADLSVLVVNEDADITDPLVMTPVLTMNGDPLSPAVIAKDLEVAMESDLYDSALGYDVQEDGTVHTTVFDARGNIVATAKVRIVIESVERHEVTSEA